MALAICFSTVVFWFFGGPNFGWTKTSVTQMKVDPVTQIEYPVVESHFSAGIDFLIAGLVLAALTFAATLMPWRPNTRAIKQTQN